MDIRIRFESDDGEYVPVLSNSTIATGNLVSQNAGTSNPGTYFYKVGLKGLNGLFATALGNLPDQPSGQLTKANDALVAAYDAKFGAGAWTRDQSLDPADVPLTSFYIPVDAANCAQAGDQLVGMLYSVGPQLTSAGITDESQYRRVYTDGFTAIVNANADGADIEAVRITMVSTGIYAGGDPTTLCDTSARLILDGIEEAAAAAVEEHFPRTVLVNAKTVRDAKSGKATGKEVDAFTHAANRRGLPVDDAGFDLNVETQR